MCVCACMCVHVHVCGNKPCKYVDINLYYCVYLMVAVFGVCLFIISCNLCHFIVNMIYLCEAGAVSVCEASSAREALHMSIS